MVMKQNFAIHNYRIYDSYEKMNSIDVLMLHLNY